MVKLKSEKYMGEYINFVETIITDAHTRKVEAFEGTNGGLIGEGATKKEAFDNAKLTLKSTEQFIQENE